MATEKRYPFSAAKHAHDIELYHNRLWNTARDMESGEIPMDKARYERITAMLDGDLRELQYALSGACCHGSSSHIPAARAYLSDARLSAAAYDRLPAAHRKLYSR